ncbi:MAG TPA: hypothetical protein VEX15_10720 [Nocardioidaceae bacterium]|nr:hypothetical protein [Nocardioidaceae bacterium]
MSANASGRPDGPLERFPCASRVMGLISLVALAVAVLVVLSHGLSLGRGAALAGVVLLALGAWLTMVRPAVHLYRDHLLVRNAVTDIAVPWHLIESVEVRQVLVIRTQERTVHGLAVGRSARKQLRSARRDQRAGGAADSGISVSTFIGRVPFFGGSSSGSQRTSSDPTGKGPAPVFGGEGVRYIDYADAVVHRIDNMADAHRRESERLTSVDQRWRRWEIAAVATVAAAFVVLIASAIVV